MYIALWTEERLVPNPYYDSTYPNVEKAEIKQEFQHWKMFGTDKELIDFLTRMENTSTSVMYYHTVSRVYPSLEKTVKLKVYQASEEQA